MFNLKSILSMTQLIFLCTQASTSFGVLGSSIAIKRSVVRPPVQRSTSVNKNNPMTKPKQLPTSQIARGGFKKLVEDAMNSTNQTGNVTPTRENPPGTPGPPDSSGSDIADPTASSIPAVAAMDELELIEETWPGKVCAFCNLGERSQLGQGEMLRLEVSQDFEAVRHSTQHSQERLISLAANAGVNKGAGQQHQPSQPSAPVSSGNNGNSKKPRLTLKGRRTSSFDASLACSELQEELNTVGYADEPDLLAIVEPCGYFYAHR